MGDKYAVNYSSASAAATSTSTAIGEIADVKTTISDALTAAEGAVPTELAGVVSRLSTLRTDHTRDVQRVKDYADKCVVAVRSCLAIYENTSAEMVAEQKKTESKVSFEHGTAFGQTEKALNTSVNKHTESTNESMPSRDEGFGRGREYESTRTASSIEKSSTTTVTNNGLSHENKREYQFGTQDGYTTESTRTTQTTSYGNASRTTTDFEGRGYNASDGGNETSANGHSVQTSSSRSSTTRTNGSMNIPVAP